MPQYTPQQWQNDNIGAPYGPISAARLQHIEDGLAAVANGGSLPDVVAPAATGVAATDTANLQAAIDATPVGGRLFIPRGTFLLNAALTVANHITIEGAGSNPTFVSATGGGFPQYPSAPFLTGTVLKQTVAATDGLKITGTGIAVNLYRFGVLFATGLASTGHGINSAPTQVVAPGHDFGITDFLWEDICVHGHDGNHFAAYILNPQYGEIIHARSYLGGGFCVEADGNTVDYGNIVWVNPYVVIMNTGTAGGYVHKAAGTTPSAGALNLMVYVRPQCNILGAALTAGTQALWNDLAGAGIPDNITVISPDLESGGGNPVTFGKYTTLVGGLKGLVNTGWTSFGVESVPYKTGIAVTAFGNKALNATTTGTENVAVGGSALALNQDGSRNTAVGNVALATSVSGADNTGVGSKALWVNTASDNTAIGSGALAANTTGTRNTAVGKTAATTVQTNSDLTAIGWNALNAATNGGASTAVGSFALMSYTTGSGSTALGYKAGYTATAANASTTAINQTFVGAFSGQPSATQSPYATALGYQALAGGTTTGYAMALGPKTSASAAGSVAIGTDSGGNGTSTAVQDQIALGTASHHVLFKTAAAPADASLAASQFTLWLDATNGAAKLMIKAKQADGTVKTAAVALA